MEKALGTITGFYIDRFDGWELVEVEFDTPIARQTIYETKTGRYHPHAVWSV